MTRYLDRLRSGGWGAVAVYLAIALVTLAVLSYLLKKSNPSHLTLGAGFVMLLYLTTGAFMILASRLFIRHRNDG